MMELNTAVLLSLSEGIEEGQRRERFGKKVEAEPLLIFQSALPLTKSARLKTPLTKVISVVSEGGAAS